MTGRDGDNAGGGGGASGTTMDPVKKEMEARADALEAELGFADVLKKRSDKTADAKDETNSPAALGWLLNFHSTSVEDAETGQVLSAIHLYMIDHNGCGFRATQVHSPYFYLGVRKRYEADVEGYMLRRFEGVVAAVEHTPLEDLDMKNHLSGAMHTFLKVTFHNVQGLMDVRREIQPAVVRNAARKQASGAGGGGALTDGMTYAQITNITRPGASIVGVEATRAAAIKQRGGNGAGGEDDAQPGGGRVALRGDDVLEVIEELREYDVPYHVRWSIDTGVRCGKWYEVSPDTSGKRGAAHSCVLTPRPDLLRHADPKVVAFDIETSKAPLQFPNAECDEIFMISYMVNKQGYLIINREWVGADIEDFEYNPTLHDGRTGKYPGPFKIFNERNERDTLQRFLSHMKEEQPGIYVTYNGDFFDWPFMEKRCDVHGLNMYRHLGFRCDDKTKETTSRYVPHLDAFCWVKRDSYLPQGSQGLKAVTKAKLKFDPEEVHHEDMVRFARDEPQTMASYSVSDAVSTYYLYMTYVHPFIFALCTIMPLKPDEVLRKGSGTLCECLLMVEAYQGGIVCPNKHLENREKFYMNHPLESETYIGGHVASLESGVFRSDLPTKFQLKADSFQKLIDRVDEDLAYCCLTEGKGSKPEDYENYDEVKQEIIQQLQVLQAYKTLDEEPMIYHLDVSAMYPNIILTNRLQPMAMVREEDCASCVYNTEAGANCKRTMEWVWKGDSYMLNTGEYHALKRQLMSEKFTVGKGSNGNDDAGAADAPAGTLRSWNELPTDEQNKILKQRLKKYCQTVYKREKDKPYKEVRNATICMRENAFYIDTVRAFRDRRYEYKALNKKWGGKVGDAEKAVEDGEEDATTKLLEAQSMVVLYDSLQLAHKCILNSFYGYVMRRGARWYSMPMAGVVTLTGAKLIKQARELVECIGRPLELDTDGIWCILPSSFPENFKFKMADGSSTTISYPCVMLNADVRDPALS